MAFERDADEIGILWLRESKAGKKYYSGKLTLLDYAGQPEEIDIVAFPFETKAGKSAIKISKSKPMGERESPF